MAVFNNHITIDRNAFKKRLGYEMDQSLQDAFNDILFGFSSAEIDKTYNDEMHQFLKNDSGDIYYFDNFKYIFPKQISEISDAFVLNNSLGPLYFCVVKYNGLAIIAERYNIAGEVSISSYFLTDEARRLIASEYMNGDMGNFLLQVSGDNMACIGKLCFGKTITIKLQQGKLVTYDASGHPINEVPTNAETGYFNPGIPGLVSFYKEVESKVDYTNLLHQPSTIELIEDFVDTPSGYRI